MTSLISTFPETKTEHEPKTGEVTKSILEIKLSIKDLFLAEFQSIKDARRASIKKTSFFSLPDQSGLDLSKGNKSSLNYHLHMANTLLLDTVDAVPFSGNNLERSQNIISEWSAKVGLVLDDVSEIAFSVNDLLLESRRLTYDECLNSVKSFNYFGICKTYYKHTINNFVGNCNEMSIVALFKGMERGIWNTPLEVVYIVNKNDGNEVKGDHYFLVIGREFNSDPKDYKTWGSAAVVMDAWLGKIFLVSEIETHLKNYIKLDCQTGKPQLCPFNPETQKLKIQVGNICSLQEFLNFMQKKIHLIDEFPLLVEIFKKLTSFHLLECGKEKRLVAKNIYQLCRQDSISALKNIKLLKYQVKHYIDLSS